MDYKAALGGNVDASKLGDGFFDEYPGGPPGAIDFSGVVNSRTVTDTADTYAGESSIGLELQANVGVNLGPVGKSQKTFETNPMVVNNRETYYLETTVVDNEEASHASFHLEDPDDGDYFVVRIYKDPDVGTPLFVLDGGASSCAWEVKTKPRTAPKMSVV